MGGCLVMVTIRTIDQARQLLSDSELDSDEWLQLQQFVNQHVMAQQVQHDLLRNAWKLHDQRIKEFFDNSPNGPIL
jgi:hypothetical protein